MQIQIHNIAVERSLRKLLSLTLACLTFLFPFQLLAYSNNNGVKGELLKIGVQEYQEKVYASWMGQLIGNFYGLPHENAYIDEPGADNFPYNYTLDMVNNFKKYNGAFSDDDTDIEYMYLLQMEKHGPEPTYVELTDAWKYHIRESVWLANRAALGLIHFGFTPPFTGYKTYNPHWFQIDPQLINEIWAVTAPGMVNYASQKSEWAARITNDSWGVDPTIHYGAMYAAAFFESDVMKLIDIGTAALPPDSRFATTVEDMKSLYRKYPDDWKTARKEMADKYYHNEPDDTKTIWNANLNGACSILALLYGNGDFQKTMDIAVAVGFDADNQTASMGGLIALIKGLKGIPESLMFPVKGWSKPFNDIYTNVSRYDLPDATIEDMTFRMAEMGEKVILMNGGKRIVENGKDFYLIKKDASFNPPLEFPVGPDIRIEAGEPVDFKIELANKSDKLEWKVVGGQLPTGLQFDNGVITGKTMETGIFPMQLEVHLGNQTASREISILVLNHNLAADAVRILHNLQKVDTLARDSLWLTVPRSLYSTDIEIIRDGKLKGEHSTYYSIDGSNSPKVDYYGYEWNSAKDIGLVTFHTGSMEEIAGWFQDLTVEYRLDGGDWKQVEKLNFKPSLIKGDYPYNKPHFIEYVLSFKPVKTTAIRIIGVAGGGKHWHDDLPSYFTSITELGVYAPLTD